MLVAVLLQDGVGHCLEKHQCRFCQVARLRKVHTWNIYTSGRLGMLWYALFFSVSQYQYECDVVVNTWARECTLPYLCNVPKEYLF